MRRREEDVDPGDREDRDSAAEQGYLWREGEEWGALKAAAARGDLDAAQLLRQPLLKLFSLPQENAVQRFGSRIGTLLAESELRPGKEESARGVALDALERAINVLNKQNVDRKQAPDEYIQTSLIQVRARTLVPEHVKSAITAFLQMTQPEEAADFKAVAAPEAMFGDK